MAQYDIKNIKSDFLGFIERVNEKNPYYLVVGVLVLVLLLDYFLIMQFQLGALRTLGPKSFEIRSEIARFETNKGRVNKYKDDIESLDFQLESLQSRIMTTEEIPVVLESLSKIANQNKVFIEQIVPDTELNDPVLENDEGNYYLLPISIQAKSSYHNLGRFLNGLENDGALMRLDRMKILANSDNSRQHDVKLMILSVIFEPKSAVRK